MRAAGAVVGGRAAHADEHLDSFTLADMVDRALGLQPAVITAAQVAAQVAAAAAGATASAASSAAATAPAGVLT